MRVFVRGLHDRSGRTVTISGVKSSDTVESFRIRLQEQDIRLRPKRQRIMCGVNQLEDDHTLAEYGVRDYTTMTFIFRPGGTRRREVMFDIGITDTVGRIKERVEEAEGVPVACQSFNYRGKELDDGCALAHDDGEPLYWVDVACRRLDKGDVGRTTNKGDTSKVVEKKTVKKRTHVEIAGSGKNIKRKKKIKQNPLAEMEAEGGVAVQLRPFRVYLIGPELEAICPSSCDTDPAG
ncbi:unnamed protein product [Alopecurus aequalis]